MANPNVTVLTEDLRRTQQELAAKLKPNTPAVSDRVPAEKPVAAAAGANSQTEGQ